MIGGENMLYKFVRGIFLKKNRLRVFFFTPTGKILRKIVNPENNRFTAKVEGQKGLYIVDPNCVVYSGTYSVPTSCYYSNNPKPIRIKHERNKEKIQITVNGEKKEIDVDSVGLHTIIQSKAITDLFKNEGAIKLLLILVVVIINLIVTLFLAYRVYKMGGGGT